MLLHGDRIVGAALHGGIVRHDDALAARHAADAGDQARRRYFVVVESAGGQLRELEEGRAAVEQAAHPLARQQLAAAFMPRPRRLAAAKLHPVDPGAKIVDQALVDPPVLLEGRIARIDFALNQRHRDDESCKMVAMPVWTGHRRRQAKSSDAAGVRGQYPGHGELPKFNHLAPSLA